MVQSSYWLLDDIKDVSVSFVKGRITVYLIVFLDNSTMEAFQESGKVYAWSRQGEMASDVALYDLEYIWNSIIRFNKSTSKLA